MKAELSWKPDYSNNAVEWAEIENHDQPPESRARNRLLYQDQLSQLDFQVHFNNANFTMFLAPVLRERHIGLDQGKNDFGMAVVEKAQNSSPKIVAAENFTNMNLPERFQVTDVLLALLEKIDLLSWMHPDHPLSQVDRVIVHLEQIDPRNRYWKQFSIDLGRLLQQQASDLTKCVVKMSQPHIHRAYGPAFQLGQKIVDDLHLEAPSYLLASKLSEYNLAVRKGPSNTDDVSDVEPSDTIEDEQWSPLATEENKKKKKMSADIFKYIVQANEEQLLDMKINIDLSVHCYWRDKISACFTGNKLKLDDVGDALLPALDEMLCGSTKFRQLIPSTPSLHNNRTVALSVFPSRSFWIVIHCMWNMFVVENFGYYNSELEGRFFKDILTVQVIRDHIHPDLGRSLQD